MVKTKCKSEFPYSAIFSIIALRGKVSFRLSQHLRILLYIAGEPQKLDRQKYMSPGLSFISFSKIQLSDTGSNDKFYPDKRPQLCITQ